ncbi:MAG: ribosome maturation factor RimM [Candidatus Melainabacteria bacterium]
MAQASDNGRDATPEDWLRIGKIVGCHGLKGHLKVRPADPEPDWLNHLKTVRWQNAGGLTKDLAVASARLKERLVMMTFDGLPDRTAAEPLVGGLLMARRSDLPAPAEGVFYAQDLMGMTVVDDAGETVRGTVRDLLSSAGQDFLEVLPQAVAPDGKNDPVLIPMNEHFIVRVDGQSRQVRLKTLTGFWP